jgi:predicted amidohydrolase YtcJ
VIIRPDQVARLARLGMTVVVQPPFITDFGDPLLAMFGDRQEGGNFFRMRSLVEAGVHLAGSSDRPVAAGSPLVGMQAMVERTTADGVFGPDERLTASEALASYTAGGARAAGCESDWGSLSPRLAADLVVLDADPTGVEPHRIGRISVMATMVGGRPVHDPGSLFDDLGTDVETGAGAGARGPVGTVTAP